MLPQDEQLDNAEQEMIRKVTDAVLAAEGEGLRQDLRILARQRNAA